ncbi:MarR family winged helix-turn-helix transcriptional regulator [Kitasatospora sp. NPDC059327]|uniref:MarR family winged helix-turn-helix transcriptional regulator n=1 Tax=Kitasatospora sp. NPDC059327 TaxID=3346803 RepID=UPI00369E72F0
MDVSKPTALEPDLMLLLSWSSHALATELTAALAELDVTPRSHCVLYKALAGDMSQSQIAEAAGLDKTTMVVVMDKLEKDGLAERRPSSVDRRARVIEVTDKGREVVAKAAEIVARINQEVLGSLPEELRHAFVAGLTHLMEGRLSTLVSCEQPPRRRSVRSS